MGKYAEDSIGVSRFFLHFVILVFGFYFVGDRGMYMKEIDGLRAVDDVSIWDWFDNWNIIELTEYSCIIMME